jgi:hypothetical protein
MADFVVERGRLGEMMPTPGVLDLERLGREALLLSSK